MDLLKSFAEQTAIMCVATIGFHGNYKWLHFQLIRSKTIWGLWQIYKKLKSISNSDMKNLFAFFMLQFACRICVLCFFFNTVGKLQHFQQKNRKENTGSWQVPVNKWMKKGAGGHFCSSFLSEMMFCLEASVFLKLI